MAVIWHRAADRRVVLGDCSPAITLLPPVPDAPRLSE
jgi:hypothetical protein